MKKDEAVKKLKRQQSLIKELEGENHESPKFHKWERDTEVAIKNIFPDKHGGRIRFLNIEYYRESSWADSTHELSHVDRYLKGLEEARSLLQSFIDEIEDYWENEPSEQEDSGKKAKVLGSDIFIVHGHDEAAKQTVARFIEKLGLKPVILHEQPNAGRTVIEKFEDYANVGFAVVLMTPDDVGASADKQDKLKPRTRQNVILELGFFLGKLGRSRVCVLYKQEVEIPSDYSGVLYLPMEGDWKLSLAKEIKNAGIEIDLNKAI